MELLHFIFKDRYTKKHFYLQPHAIVFGHFWFRQVADAEIRVSFACLRNLEK